MSSYPPPPSDQQQYNAFLDHTQQDQLQLGNLNQPIFSPAKVDDANRPYSPSGQALARELQNANLNEPYHQQILQAAQHQSPAVPVDPISNESHLHTHESASEQPQKSNRLRKACDSCSMRKVKCDESGPPCRACAVLEIPCTFDRPSRRRGPPNRHADAIKRRRLEDPSSPYVSVTPISDPSSSPTHAAQALAALSSHTSAHVSAESICPLDTLDILIDEFFRCIYPTNPFPHEPSFREAWKRRDDHSDKSFLALLAAMIGSLVASFPRKPRLFLDPQRREVVTSNYTGLVSRCQQICITARGPSHSRVDALNVHDAATSYYLALIGLHSQNFKEHRFYLGECVNILSLLDLQIAMSSSQTEFNSQGLTSSNPITLETGRRIYGAVRISVKRFEQASINSDPPPSLPFTLKTNVPLPTEVDDYDILPGHTESQPNGLLPLISGFNIVVRIFDSYDSFTNVVAEHGANAASEQLKDILLESLRRCKTFLDDLPSDLSLASDNSTSGQLVATPSGDLSASYNQPRFFHDPAQMFGELPASLPNIGDNPQDERENRYRVQRAAILISVLQTRFYLVKQYWALRASSNPELIIQNTATDEAVAQEVDYVVRDLLSLLSAIDQVNTAPNADFFNTALRSIAHEVINQPHQQKGQLALQSQTDIVSFLQLLSKLEDPANGDVEVDSWAELKNLQMKFAHPDGIFGFT